MTKTKSLIFAAVSAAALAACGGNGADGGSRDSIRAVGSSTVFPF
ncbi:MAG TPA: phosphate ABC transporter substrate-binding protein, partial [Erythrobacter sp.]|nr:phosphate ABC transporter substrate-binding protein [Erythrobacter sp.]